MDRDRKIEVMGVVNLTGDSYYASSRCLGADGRVDVARAMERVRLLVGEGADIIDIGACSTRPGAETVGELEEWTRLEPVLRAVWEEFPDVRVSIDTYWASVARKSFELLYGIRAELDKNAMPYSYIYLRNNGKEEVGAYIKGDEHNGENERNRCIEGNAGKRENEENIGDNENRVEGREDENKIVCENKVNEQENICELARKRLIINDISAGEDDPAMLPTVGELGLTYIAMHKRGTPKTMQSLCDYEDVTREVLEYFKGFDTKAKKYGIRDWIIDPGFGFAKTIEQNYQLLSDLREFTSAGLVDEDGNGRRVLVGVSRKSMIYKLFGITPEESLPQTQVLHLIALQNGADILRVHDVAEARRTVEIYRRI